MLSLQTPTPKDPAKQDSPRPAVHTEGVRPVASAVVDTRSDDPLGRALAVAVQRRAAPPMVQRTIKVGLPGAGGPGQTTYNTANAATLTAALVAPLGPPMPGWVAAWLPAQLTTTVNSAIAYEFDTMDDVVRWALLREILAALETFMTGPAPAAPVKPRARQTRGSYAALEGERTRFVAAGDGDGAFKFCGLDYIIERQAGRNHYYVYRIFGTKGKKSIVYSGVQRSAAIAVITHMVKEGHDARYGGAPSDVDDFVCAFFAESTRWSLERVLNVLALTRPGAGDSKLTGDALGSLPMASGSTYEPASGEIGRQTPRRALQHADSEGIWAHVAAALPTSTDLTTLVTAVKTSLKLT